MPRATKPKAVKEGTSPFKVMYIDPQTKLEYAVTDAKAESRLVPETDRTGLPVAPSHYDRYALNLDVTEDLIAAHPEIADYVIVGDIIDSRELDAFLNGTTVEKTESEDEE